MGATKWAAVVALLCLVYGYGLFGDPAKWEEPRRSLISIEMALSGDYVVPRLLGEPYLNKPPLFNWLGLALAGNRAQRVGPWAFRVVSLVSLAAVCVLLWRLGVSGSEPRSDPLPALVFATMGIVVQFGRAGEIDMLLCALTTAALACFEFGRRRDSALLRWVAPQVFVGLGVLAKIVAPVFFYPAAVISAWRGRKGGRVGIVAPAVGALLMTSIVAVWLVAYAQRQALEPLQERWVSEVVRRFHAGAASSPAHTLASVLGHLVRYPVEVVGALLPWSLWLVCLCWPWPRRVFRRALRDPLVELSTIVVAIVVAGHAFAVGGSGRYLMPAFPFVALLAARMVRDLQADARAGEPLRAARASPKEAGAEARSDVALEAGTSAGRERARGGVRGFVASGRAFRWTLASALLYALVYVTTTERARARSGERYRGEAREVAAALKGNLPVVVDPGVPYRLVYPLYRELSVMPTARVPEASPYDWVAREQELPPVQARLLVETERFRAWEVRP